MASYNPTGLECLNSVDEIIIQQNVQLLAALTEYDSPNRYAIMNSAGKILFCAVEHSVCCLERNRSFDMLVFDKYYQEIIHMIRPVACNSCCFPCCLQGIQVCVPPDILAGTVQQKWSICGPRFEVTDPWGKPMFKIKGRCCIFEHVDFEIWSNHELVGNISKAESTFGNQFMNDAYIFGVAFTKHVDVGMKAVIIGACFLINVLFFAQEDDYSASRPSMSIE